MTATPHRPAVLITRRIPSSVVARLETACDVEVFPGDRAIPREELLRRVKGKDALVCLLTDRIDREVIEAGTSLKIVANIAVGYDNVDVQSARSLGVIVTNTPDVLTDAVAEFTWALILAITRRTSEGERVVRRGEWQGWALDFMLGSQLTGKQLGILGMGRIGMAVASKAPAFGMRVAYHSADPPNLSLWTGDLPLPPMEEMSLDRLFSSSHVVSLHVPLAPGTRHLIGQEALLRMRRSAFLVNTSRGPVVDEEALVWALRERVISGAALDVYEREPEIHPGLLALENVVLAPHLGSATTETRTAMADLAASNVLAVLAGERPLTPVGVAPASP